MTIVIPQRITKLYLKNRHDFRRIQKFHSIANSKHMKNDEKESKWWKLCKDRVEYVFKVLNAEVRSHKIKKLYQKRYAERMYDHLFNFYFVPNSESLRYLNGQFGIYPSNISVSINPDKLKGIDRFNNTMHDVIRSSLLFMKIHRYKLENAIGLKLDRTDLDTEELYEPKEFIDEILPALMKDRRQLDSTIRFKQDLYNKWFYWIRNENSKLNRYLNIYGEQISIKVKVHDGFYNFILSFQQKI